MPLLSRGSFFHGLVDHLAGALGAHPEGAANLLERLFRRPVPQLQGLLPACSGLLEGALVDRLGGRRFGVGLFVHGLKVPAINFNCKGLVFLFSVCHYGVVAPHPAATNLENPMATEISKQLLKTLRPQIDAALAELARTHGITLRAGNGSFDPVAGAFHFKLEGAAIGAPGKDASRYISHAAMLGLPARGTEFNGAPMNTRYRTDGLNTVGSKVIVERVDDGKKFLMNTEFVVAACKAQAVAA